MPASRFACATMVLLQPFHAFLNERRNSMKNRIMIFVVGLLIADTSSAMAQVTPDQQADMLLNSARKAFNEKNYAFATTRFREYLSKFGGHKENDAGRYGLALALIEGPEKKWDEARDLLQQLATKKEFGDRELAGYYAGVAVRGMGHRDLAEADAKPADAANYRASAQARFGEAIPLFTSALSAFNAKDDKVEDGNKLTLNGEWVARARCDLAEVQLRAGKLKEAQASAMLFVSDPVWTKSQYRDLGRYYHGYASVLLKDNIAGQKTLSLLAPFSDPTFGNHARYLLARTHHIGDDRAEAGAHYEGAIADYAKAKADAINLLKQPQQFKNDPTIRAQLESLAKSPTPDHVARAAFYLGVLLYEGGKFSEAKTRFAEFVKEAPQATLRLEAEIRIGYCQVQLKEYADAIKTLTPLVEREARLSDQVLFWLAKAQAASAPDAVANPPAHQAAISAALNTFRQAADRAAKFIEQDPDAKIRRAEILLELADQQQRITQNKEAAVVYAQLLSEKILTEREEEITQRLADALHLSRVFDESDKVCLQFQQRFPQSTLTPAVLFIYAENSWFRINTAEKNLNLAERAKEMPRLYDEAVKRFGTVVAKYPEFSKINIARYSLGLTYYRQGDLTNAQKTLGDIPATDRMGDLSLTPYLIADCLLRQTPTTVPVDALAAGKMEEQLKNAAEALDTFINANPKDANVYDAHLRLGLTQQRQAELIAQPAERVKRYTDARATYERLLKKDSGAPPLHLANAMFERAKCITLSGDMNTGMNELRKFTTDPLRQGPVAPQAILQLATYLRAQNKANDAVELFVKHRDSLEAVLAKDQTTATPMIGLLRYHHGVALREAGKLPEARGLFETVVKMGIQRVEATEAALRIGQCLKDEGQLRLEAARKLHSNIKKPDDLANAQKVTEEGYKMIHDAVTYLETQADAIKATPTLLDARARMIYDAAWGARQLAEPEVAATRTLMALEAQKKLNISSKFPLPEISIEKIPVQASEKRARGLYKLLIDQAGDLPIGIEARYELAEMLAERNEFDPAILLLSDVLDKEPNPEMTEKTRLRLGGIHAAKGNIKVALTQFNAVASNPKSSLVGWANYRAAEVLIKDQQYGEAIKRLTMFRDNGTWNNVPGLTDRALLRLGYAFAVNKSWDESRSAYERIVNAFPNSSVADDARYGIGWALQQQKNYDGAANAYSSVVARTATELAAKAQLQIGLCRMEQKRHLDAVNAFLVIPTTYDYPELRAAALYEAGLAYLELNQREQANRQFERVLREFPGTPWADAAKEKLGVK